LDASVVDASPPYGSDRFVFQLEQYATSARVLVDALLPLAQQGNAAASYALRRALERCLGFVGSLRSRDKVTAPAGSEDAIWQAKLIERGRKFCDDPRMDDVQQFSVTYLIPHKALRAQGEEVAVALSLVPDWQIGQEPAQSVLAERRAAAWELVRNAQNPYAVEAAMSALAALPEDTEGPTWHLTTEASELFAGDHARMRTLAAMWYACELGADCRPYGVWQQGACLHQRNCAPHLPLQDFIRERLLTPSQYAAMQRYLDVIRAERARQ
jgi:hypothetical protein